MYQGLIEFLCFFCGRRFVGFEGVLRETVDGNDCVV